MKKCYEPSICSGSVDTAPPVRNSDGNMMRNAKKEGNLNSNAHLDLRLSKVFGSRSIGGESADGDTSSTNEQWMQCNHLPE